MATPLIKLPGQTGSKPKAKAKPAAKRQPTKQTPAKRTPKAKAKPAKAKAKPAAKRTPKARPQPAADARIAKDGRVLRTPKDMDTETLSSFESRLSEAGQRAKAAKAEHDAAIDAVHEVVSEARNAGVPMAIIEDASGVSRQWLYKMGSMKKRINGNGNGNGSKDKASATTAVKRAAKSAANKTAKTTPRKRQPAKRGSSVVKLA